MSRAVLLLGSNLGDRAEYLSVAVQALGEEVRAVSSIYRTPPWGPVPQDDYYNIAILAEDDSTSDATAAYAWLHRCRLLEKQAGRVRDIRWGPRTLDADVIVVGDVRLDDEALELPHPRAHERAFVLMPWIEIEPDAAIPGRGRIDALLAELDPRERAAIVRVGHVAV